MGIMFGLPFNTPGHGNLPLDYAMASLLGMGILSSVAALTSVCISDSLLSLVFLATGGFNLSVAGFYFGSKVAFIKKD